MSQSEQPFEEFCVEWIQYYRKKKIGQKGDDNDAYLIFYYPGHILDHIILNLDYSPMIKAKEMIYEKQPAYYFFVSETWGTVHRELLYSMYGGKIANMPARVRYEELWLIAGQKDPLLQKFLNFKIIRDENQIITSLQDQPEKLGYKNRLQDAYG